MTEFLIKALPWLLSANTLYVMFLAGNKKKYAWALGLAGQLFWLIWIVLVQAWGLLPMNIGLWVVYSRNHFRWSSDQTGTNKGEAE
jgi:hypothetical protein